MVRKVRRLALVPAAVVVGIMALAGCTGTQSTGTGSAAAGPATIKVWDWNAGQDYYATAFKKFTEKNPNTTVQYQFQAGTTFGTTVQAAFQSNSEPDVFMGYFDTIPSLISKGWIQPIGSVNDPATKAWMATFPAGSFNQNAQIFDGKVYSFPYNPQSTIYLYYNKKVLADAGITKPPTTWTQLRDDAKKVTGSSGGKASGMVTGAKDVWPWFMNVSYLAATAGACNAGVGGSSPIAFDYSKGIYNPDNPATKAAMQLWLDMKADGSIIPGVDSLTDAQATAAFGTGRAAFMFSGSWLPSVLKQVAPSADFGVAAVPVPDSGRKGYDLLSSGFSWVLSSKTTHKAAAIDVLKYISSVPFAEGYVKSGAGLSVFPQVNTPQNLSLKGMADVASIALKTTKAAPILDPKAGIIKPIFSDPQYPQILSAIWNGSTSVDAGLADLQARMNKALPDALKGAGINNSALTASTAGKCGSY